MSKTIFILDTEYQAATTELESRLSGFELCCGEVSAPESVVALVVDSALVSVETLQAFPNVQFVIKLGRNTSNIAPNVLADATVPVVSVPRKGPNCVAELAVTLMLALSKDLLMSHQSVASGAYRFRGLRPEASSQNKMAFHWMKHASLHEVRGKTLGIIGMGEIGCEVAFRAKALGVNILYYKRSPLPPDLEAQFDARYCALDDLISQSDYVLLAVPHTPDTERMFDASKFALMKPSSYLINICRGGVVDEDAMINALQTQQIAGAGLDVFTYEPLAFDSPLCQLHNVILTPHVGGGSGTNRTLELGEALDEVGRRLMS